MRSECKSYIPPSGPKNAHVAIVGEQPGKREVIERRPFAGPSGEELDRCLNSAGLSRSLCYVTNTIKCLDHPLSHYILTSRNSIVGFTPAGKEHVEILKEELSELRPNVVVAVGNVALLALCNRVGITQWRGSVLPSSLVKGLKVIPIIHPATILPPKMQYLNKYLIIQDLHRVWQQMDSPELPVFDDEFIIRPSLHAALTYLDFVLQEGMKGKMLAFDIEVSLQSGEITCLSIADSPTSALCIPLVDANGDYWSVDEEGLIWRAVARVLEDESIVKIGQNVVFDAHYLLRKFGIRCRNLHDVMVAQKINYPDFPVALNFTQSIYTLRPYHKEDGKKHIKIEGEWNKFYIYNCLDSVVCLDAFPKQVQELTRTGNLETYERQRKIIPALAYMMEKGIRVDLEGMDRHRERNTREIASLTEELHSLAGRELNPNSPKQLKEYFYGEKKLHAYKKRDGKGGWTVTCDDNAMMRLDRQGVPEAKLIRKIRELMKENSNYLSREKVDKDGRYRCSYNPVGTDTGRLSSSKNIFGTGGNLQNWPHSLLSYLLPDEGYVYFDLDLSQAENRLVAYGGDIAEMIEAFESGVDVHKKTAALLYRINIEEVTDAQRQYGKKANHGLNYDEGYRTFARTNDITEKEAKWIVERYHLAYPGVRQGFHVMIQRMLKNGRTVINCMGRRRIFLDMWGDSLLKAAYAHFPQSTVSDIINERGVNYIYYNQREFEHVQMLGQKHDSIGIQLPLNIGWIKMAEILLKIKTNMELPLQWKHHTFSIPVDISMNTTLGKKGSKEFKASKTPQDPEVFGLQLKLAYEEMEGRWTDNCQTL